MNRKWIIKNAGVALLFLGSAWPIASKAEVQPAETSSSSLQPALRLPERATWTIDFVYDSEERANLLGGKQGKSQRKSDQEDPLKDRLLPRRITVTKNGVIYREATLWTNGKLTEKWIQGDYQVLELPTTGELVRVGLAGRSIYRSDYSQGDFGELTWASQAQFKGVRKIGDREFLEFSRQPDRLAAPALDGPGEEEILTTRPLTALFFKENQRPYLWDDGEITKIYSYPSTSGEALVVPPRFSEEFKAWQAQIDKRKLKSTRSTGAQ